MKLSNISGDRALTVLADVIEPIGAIMSDEEIQKMVKRKSPMLTIVGKALKTHANEVYAMLAALDGVTIEEYKKNTSMSKILCDFADVVTDESLQSLFDSAKPTKAEK